MPGAPQSGYAQTSDGSYVAFETRGNGPLDLLEVSNGTLFSYTSAVEQPAWIDYVDRLASFSRLIRCDPRGVGLSDPLPSGASTAESYADEIMAVLDGAASESATLVGATYAGAGAILAAATHPERVHALVLINSYARLARSDDYPIGIPSRLLDLLRDATRPEVDGLRTDGAAGDLPLMAPSLAGIDGMDRWWVEAGRRGASPGAARAIIAAFVELDVRSVLPEVRVPTLVLHARDNRFVRPNLGRYLADHIVGAHYFELPCADHVPWANGDLYAGEIEEFLTGARRVDRSHRVLATVLFTDIVDSTRRAGRSAPPWPCGTRRRRWGFRSAPACTSARSRCAATMSPASPFTLPRGSPPRPGPTRSSSPRPSRSSSRGRVSSSRIAGPAT